MIAASRGDGDGLPARRAARNVRIGHVEPLQGRPGDRPPSARYF